MTKIDISTSTLLRFVLILAGLWLLFVIRDILVLLFMVLIIVAALSPSVDRWSRYLTRPGAVVMIFFLIFLAITLAFSLLIPPLVDQLRDFSLNLPLYVDQLSRADSPFLEALVSTVKDNLNHISSQLSNLSGAILSRTIGVVSGVVAIIAVIVLSFYLLLEEEGMRKMYRGLLPDEWYSPFSEVTRKIAGKLGAWLRGQLILMALVGLMTAIGLYLVGQPYALTLGIWSGLVEIIPIVGPWIGAVPGVVIGLAESPLQGLLVLVVYLVVQQIEAAVLIPKIMGRAVGLNPFVVILAILIGGKLYGLTGILISVPVAAVISVVVEDWAVISETVRSKGRDVLPAKNQS
jgi:predicted PurR-regulated permease PerM